MTARKKFLSGYFVFVALFILFCVGLMAQSGIFSASDGGDSGIMLASVAAEEASSAGSEVEESSDEGGDNEPVIKGFSPKQHEHLVNTIGAADPCEENPDKEGSFRFQLELDSYGASIKKVIFSAGKDEKGKRRGFDDRDRDNPEPLVLLSPAGGGDKADKSLSNKSFYIYNKIKGKPNENVFIRLNYFSWKYLGKSTNDDGSQIASFEIVIPQDGKDLYKLTKRYTVYPGSYDVDCSVLVENVSAEDEQKYSFSMNGPLGIDREGLRGDMRKIIGGFVNADGKVSRESLKVGKLRKATTVDDTKLESDEGSLFLWGAVTNKYFAGIAVPKADDGKQTCSWLRSERGAYYQLDQTGEDATLGVLFETMSNTLSAGGEKSYDFKLYFGPKDKGVFDGDQRYKDLGFVHVIDFMGCCCPAALIRPLAFGILWFMEFLYSYIGNYGVVIIILVFIVRLILHPLTKKGQVSMSKMTKLAPRVKEIQNKYANDKAEMNKHVMALYRDSGASPITGMLPMFVQMPIWIALYSAIYASVSLRGAAFLPVWITDLSAPDALIVWKAIKVPLLGWEIDSLNLLPLLMGVAFFLQQKMMPQQSPGTSSPQMEQQQKMMKIMMPILFPLMLYKAPSGLNLYIMSSVSAGVFEQYIIRKHIREQDAKEEKFLVSATSKTGGKVKKKKPKPFYKN